MRIPLSAIDARSPVAGNTMRINLFPEPGTALAQQAVYWQAPMKDSFHVPERLV